MKLLISWEAALIFIIYVPQSVDTAMTSSLLKELRSKSKTVSECHFLRQIIADLGIAAIID
jgi:hypothetical protein